MTTADRVPETPFDFVASREDVKAVIGRIGLNNTQVILVARDGEWLRYVVPTVEDAQDMCERLKVESSDGYTDEIRQRMGSYQRTPEDWAEAPYPERQRGSST
ncbi:MAG TPA: hypothetical protein VNA87_01610 [Actinomycetota bacterium]|nr:hypothetical protein [Actinomycetota bacterium]